MDERNMAARANPQTEKQIESKTNKETVKSESQFDHYYSPSPKTHLNTKALISEAHFNISLLSPSVPITPLTPPFRPVGLFRRPLKTH